MKRTQISMLICIPSSTISHMDKRWKPYSLLLILKVSNIKLQGKQFTLFYSKFKIVITFLLGFGLDGTLFLCGRIGRVLVGWKERKNLSCLI